MNPTLSAGGHLSETIAAISTAAGEGAIALLRMSGPESVAIAERIFQGRKAFQKMESHRQYHGAIVDGDRKLDEVLLAVHRAPRSYTGEDVVEIACHGGLLVTRRILELLLRRGARPARPGEFTQRAYLNGKLDLTQAEAVMDLITAQSDRALAAAQQQLEGRLGERLRALRASYLETLAHLEAFIDFPEEDITPETGEELRARCQELCAQIAGLLSTAERGRHWREGVKTVIFGAPNVGKSSLLNLLLGYERAIVSAQPGTTRDALEETVNVRGIPLRLVDTAGIRDATEEAERAGIARTFQQAGRADLILHLQDAGAPPSREAAPDPTKAILVLNKCDLAENPAWHGREGIRISCREQTGLATLEEAIERRVLGASGSLRSHELAINIRHETGLRQALDFTEQAAAGLAANAPPELIAEDLRAAADAVGEIVGRVDSEDVLGRIFSTFCIGK